MYEPISLGAGTAIAAGISALSAGGQAYATGKTNRKTRQFTEKMYARERADRQADWNQVNDYNSPLQQMQRLKEAGLNPHLVYDNGATHTASSVPSTQHQSWNPETPDIKGIGQAAMQGLGAYQDFTLQQEQVKNMQQQRANMEMDNLLKGLQASGYAVKNAQDSLDLDKARKTFDTSISQIEENLRATKTRTDIAITEEVRDAAMHAPNLATAIERVAALHKSTQLTDQQIRNLKNNEVLQKLEINMRNKGMTYNDNIILRMLAQFAGGTSLPDLLKNLYKQVDSWSNENVKEEIQMEGKVVK